MLLFTLRSTSRGAELFLIARWSNYTGLVPLSDSTMIAIRDLPLFAGVFIFYVTSVGQYILDGVFEFFSLLQLRVPMILSCWGATSS